MLDSRHRCAARPGRPRLIRTCAYLHRVDHARRRPAERPLAVRFATSPVWETLTPSAVTPTAAPLYIGLAAAVADAAASSTSRRCSRSTRAGVTSRLPDAAADGPAPRSAPQLAEVRRTPPASRASSSPAASGIADPRPIARPSRRCSRTRRPPAPCSPSASSRPGERSSSPSGRRSVASSSADVAHRSACSPSTASAASSTARPGIRWSGRCSDRRGERRTSSSTTAVWS